MSQYIRTILLCQILICILAPIRPAASSTDVLATDYDRGKRFMSAGQWADAERMFLKAIEQDPTNADYHFELANVYAAQHDKARQDHRSVDSYLSRAARELEQTVMYRPDYVSAQYNLGVVYKKQGRFEEAREQFKKVLPSKPHAISAHMQIGAIYEEQGFFDDARDSYLRAQEMDYFNPAIKTALAELKDSEEKYRQRAALESLERQASQSISGGFNFSKDSHAYKYQQDRMAGRQSGQSVQQAIPYIGAMLVQEFMKRKNPN